MTLKQIKNFKKNRADNQLDHRFPLFKNGVRLSTAKEKANKAGITVYADCGANLTQAKANRFTFPEN